MIDYKRQAIANIIARAGWGSLYPAIGTPDDVPCGVTEQDYRAADAIIDFLLASAPAAAAFVEGSLNTSDVVSRETPSDVTQSAPAAPAGGYGWRPEVVAFANLMERQLRANDHKPGWKNAEPVDLMEHAASEIEELWKAVNDWMDHSGPTQVKYRDNVQREAADVANMVMMVADVCGALAPSAPSATCKESLQVHTATSGEGIDQAVHRLAARMGAVFVPHDRTPPIAAPAGDVIDNIVRDVYELDGYTNTNDPDYLCLTIRDLRVILERQLAAPAGDDTWLRAFRVGERVEKISGSSWRGIVVGTYSTDLTPEGYAVESENEPGSVQIYPVWALRTALSASPAPKSGEIA